MLPVTVTLPLEKNPGRPAGEEGAEELKEEGDQQRAGTAAQTGRPQEGREPASWRREGPVGSWGRRRGCCGSSSWS